MTEVTLSSPYFVAAEDSILLTNDNFEQYLGKSGVFHTSLGDITAANLLLIADYNCTFIFVDQGFDNQTALYEKTIIFLNAVFDSNTIIGYIRPGPATFAEQSIMRPPGPRLWVFGCSLSAGVGVNESEVYSTKLSVATGLPVTTVARVGSSTHWSLRQLLHADIWPTDIVIWQLTTIERFTVKQPNRWPKEVMLKDADRETILSTTDEQLWFDQLSLVNCGVQYLRAIGPEFYMISLDSSSPLLNVCLEQYTRYPEYCYVPDWQIDLGTDGLHPGPQSHHLLYRSLEKKLR
jgi:hypothetical protein